MAPVALATTSSAAPDRPCLRCGYELRGLADEGRCPECGLPVARSAVPADELRHAPPAWLASLSWGVRLILAAFVGAYIVSWHLAPRLFEISPAAYSGTQAALALTFAKGVWLLTHPQPRFGTSGPAWRWALRIAALGPLVSAVGNYFVIRNGVRSLVIHVTPDVVGVAAFAALPVLLLLHLRRLALHGLGPWVVEHCTIAGVGGTACGTMGLLMMFVRVPFTVELVTAAFGILFCLWWLYLLVRFAVAFTRAHRASVVAWG